MAHDQHQPSSTARAALGGIWELAALPPSALTNVELKLQAPILPSSFRVADMATATTAAAANWTNLADGIVGWTNLKKCQLISKIFRVYLPFQGVNTAVNNK